MALGWRLKEMPIPFTFDDTVYYNGGPETKKVKQYAIERSSDKDQL